MDLNQRNNQNESKMRDLLRELQIQKEKKKTMDELLERKTRKMEGQNQDLLDKIRNDENLLREKTDLANKLRAEN